MKKRILPGVLLLSALMSANAGAWWNNHDDDYDGPWRGGRWYGYPGYGWGGYPGYGWGGYPGYGWGGNPGYGWGDGSSGVIVVNPERSQSRQTPYAPQ